MTAPRSTGILLPREYPAERKARVHKKAYTRLVMAASFIIARHWQQPNSPQENVQQTVYAHTREDEVPLKPHSDNVS